MEEDTEKKKIICKEKKLSLFSIILFIPPFIWYDDLYNFYYLTPCAIIIIFTILWNFPFIATSLHTKPLYLCDLTGDSLDVVIKDKNQREEFHKIKDKYILTFNITLAVITSLAAGAILDIWLYKTKGKEDIPEIIGITGGILSIYSKVQTYVGYFLLSVFVQIKREKEKQMCFVSNLDSSNENESEDDNGDENGDVSEDEKNKLEENQIKSDQQGSVIALLELREKKDEIVEENIKMDIKENKSS